MKPLGIGLGAIWLASALAGAEAVSQAELKAAAAKSVALLQSSSTEFFKQSGCVGCHHQNFTALAVAAAQIGRASCRERV